MLTSQAAQAMEPKNLIGAFALHNALLMPFKEAEREAMSAWNAPCVLHAAKDNEYKEERSIYLAQEGLHTRHSK